MTSENVTLVIYDVASGKKVTIQTGEPKDQYLTMVSWEPTGKHIFIGIGIQASLSREAVG